MKKRTQSALKGFRKTLVILLPLALLLSSCAPAAKSASAAQAVQEASAEQTDAAREAAVAGLEQYKGMTAEEIVSTLTLEEKAAQMVQGAIYNVSLAEMKQHDYGSVLSRVEELPNPTDLEWYDIVCAYQDSALSSEAAIPFIYGQDSVHGVNYASGAVLFPQNINMGAVNDPALMKEYGALVGSDIAHTGMLLNFSPCVDAAQDPRWGRTYECFSDDNEIIKNLSVPYAEGLLSEGVVVCPKHFFGAGYTQYGSGEVSDSITRIIDRGDARMSEEEIGEQLAVYEALVKAGVQSIMVSHSALWGTKMHENAAAGSD